MLNIIDTFWLILTNFDSSDQFWPKVTYFGLFWLILTRYEQLKSILTNFAQFWPYMTYFGQFLINFGQIQPILTLFGQFGQFWLKIAIHHYNKQIRNNLTTYHQFWPNLVNFYNFLWNWFFSLSFSHQCRHSIWSHYSTGAICGFIHVGIPWR